MKRPLLDIQDLQVQFKGSGGSAVRAVDGVDLQQQKGETLGIVGESGCGKSTLARAVLRLVKSAGGRVLFDGTDLFSLSEHAMRQQRRHMQLVFQDPFASLDPRFTVARTLEEPLIVHGIGARAERIERVAELLALVGLDAAAAGKYPHEFSGGQRQRIAIARAIALGPKLLIADEPVSALDVSVQSQILNLLVELREKLGLSILFISHDLAVVRLMSERVAVMYLGRIVELADAKELFEHPLHPYTEALLSAIPRPVPKSGRKRIVLGGDMPSPEAPPPGCPFHPRCFKAIDRCRQEVPETRDLGTTSQPHLVRCHLAEPG